MQDSRNYTSIPAVFQSPILFIYTLFVTVFRISRVWAAMFFKRVDKEILRKYNIDLLIPPSPLLLAFDNNIPYIVPIPDVMYKYYPGFPEYSFKDNIISDIVFRYSAKYARLCITDSASGKNDVMKFFHQPEDKIRAIPYIPPGYVFENKDMTRNQANDILLKYTLPDKFIFYPAQFWFHKNHLRLVKSIAIIKHDERFPVGLLKFKSIGVASEIFLLDKIS